MAATTAGALKTLIEGLGLGLAAYRDQAPEGSAKPYVRISEGITVTVDRDGDFGDTAAAHTATEEVQLDLFQQHRHPTTEAITESYTLPDALTRGLHGARLTAAPTRVYGVRQLNRTRFPDDGANVVRHLFTLAIHRVI